MVPLVLCDHSLHKQLCWYVPSTSRDEDCVLSILIQLGLRYGFGLHAATLPKDDPEKYLVVSDHINLPEGSHLMRSTSAYSRSYSHGWYLQPSSKSESFSSTGDSSPTDTSAGRYGPSAHSSSHASLPASSVSSCSASPSIAFGCPPRRATV